MCNSSLPILLEELCAQPCSLIFLLQLLLNAHLCQILVNIYPQIVLVISLPLMRHLLADHECDSPLTNRALPLVSIFHNCQCLLSLQPMLIFHIFCIPHLRHLLA